MIIWLLKDLEKEINSSQCHTEAWRHVNPHATIKDIITLTPVSIYLNHTASLIIRIFTMSRYYHKISEELSS